MTQRNILPHVGGSLLTEKNDKLAQTDRLWRYRDVRGIQKGQVTQAQPEIQNRGVTVAIESSLGSAGTQGSGGAKDMVPLLPCRLPPLHFLVSLQHKPVSKHNLGLPLCCDVKETHQ